MKSLVTTLLLMAMLTVSNAAGEYLTYSVDGKPYEGYMLKASGDAPMILLVHDWDGLTDYEVMRAKMLNELGYAVFAVDLFGKGVRPTAIEEKRRLTGALYKERQLMRSRLDGALETARAKGFDVENGVAVGYCFGGAAVLELARSGANLKAFVTFHGGLKTPKDQDYSKTRGSILVLHGSADKSVTMEEFAALTRELERHKIVHEMTTYSGAPHAFSVFGSDRYHEAADRKSWNRLIGFLEEVTARR